MSSAALITGPTGEPGAGVRVIFVYPDGACGSGGGFAMAMGGKGRRKGTGGEDVEGQPDWGTTRGRGPSSSPPPPHVLLARCFVFLRPRSPVEEDKGSVRRVPERESKVDSSSLSAADRGHGNDEYFDSDSDDLRRAAPSNYGHN